MTLSLAQLNHAFSAMSLIKDNHKLGGIRRKMLALAGFPCLPLVFINYNY
jgi:hypothetical protein